MSLGCPLPPYIKEGRRGPAKGRRRAQGGSPTPTRSRTPPFPIWRGRGKEEEGGRKERGGQPPSQFELGLAGAPSLAPFPSFPLKPIKAQYSSLYSRNSSVLRKIPESLGTFPMSEYSLPIYQSFRLGHFETPRHVPDLIRDTKLLRYIKTHELIIPIVTKC